MRRVAQMCIGEREHQLLPEIEVTLVRDGNAEAGVLDICGQGVEIARVRPYVHIASDTGNVGGIPETWRHADALERIQQIIEFDDDAWFHGLSGSRGAWRNEASFS
jgi:hypothetical protein